MNKKTFAIILGVISIILIILAIIIQYFYNSNEQKQYNRIPTNYICKKEVKDGDKTITTYIKIITDEFLAIQNVNNIIEYKYINNLLYEEAKEKNNKDKDYKYEYNDKDMIISVIEKNDIENLKNQYYYSYISYFEPGFDCTPHSQKDSYQFVCSNGSNNFELTTDNKMVVTDIINENDNQVLLDNLNNIQRIWINKYIEVLNDGYNCKLKNDN